MIIQKFLKVSTDEFSILSVILHFITVTHSTKIKSRFTDMPHLCSDVFQLILLNFGLTRLRFFSLVILVHNILRFPTYKLILYNQHKKSLYLLYVHKNQYNIFIYVYICFYIVVTTLKYYLLT